MNQSILHTLTYFELFSYPPTIIELNIFLEKKASKEDLEKIVEKLEKQGILYRSNNRVALKKLLFENYEKRRRRSIYYFKMANKYLAWTEHIFSIQLLGVSGSLSMMNMTEKGDIDIFVITTSKTVWTTRFILLMYKYFLKFKNPDIGNKLCFNLIFSEDGLEIAKNKQNEYIGHEILQLKPIVNKNRVYDRFLKKNSWISKFFPNVLINVKKNNLSKKMSENSGFPEFIEYAFKMSQVWWLNIKNIHWDYRGGQLWLIQEDYEEKVRKI